jgi:hypothetical protein
LNSGVPVIATSGSLTSTTGNIGLYIGEISGQETMLIDIEGIDGKIPLSFLKRFGEMIACPVRLMELIIQ